MVKLQDVYSVLSTPFMPDAEIGLASLRRVIDLYLSAGVNGLTALGFTSQTARLNEHELWTVLDTVLEYVSGRVPVVVR